MTAPAARLPLEPLEELARTRADAAANYDARPVAALAELLHVSRRAVHRWKGTGGIPYWTADRIACHALELHPALIWPAEWYAGPADTRKDTP